MPKNDTINFIPKELRSSHEYCFFLHGLLTEVIVTGEEMGIFSTEVEFRNNKDKKEIEKIKSSEELLSWLESNGYLDSVITIYYKQILLAMLSDFCHYVYEALECSRKSKLAVTFTLLRKPFKENLLIFEWILSNPVEFFSIFHKDLALSINKVESSEEKKLEIIKTAMGMTNRGEWVPASFIYKLRYDKKAEFSFEYYWQKATHLITTHKHLKTEAQNFNFIFSGNESFEAQWTYLYSFLPILLLHTFEIVEAILKNIARRKKEVDDITDLRVQVGFLLWLEDGPWDAPTTEIKNNFSSNLYFDEIICPKCKKTVFFGKRNMKLFYRTGTIKCAKCRSELNLNP